jgi:hypothetical protein
MDGRNFDALTRSLALGASRRNLMQALGASLMGGFIASGFPVRSAQAQTTPPTVMREVFGRERGQTISRAARFPDTRTLLKDTDRKGFDAITDWFGWEIIKSGNRCVRIMGMRFRNLAGELRDLRYAEKTLPNGNLVQFVYEIALEAHTQTATALDSVTGGIVTTTPRPTLPPDVRAICVAICQTAEAPALQKSPCDIITALYSLCTCPASQILDCVRDAVFGSDDLCQNIKSECDQGLCGQVGGLQCPEGQRQDINGRCCTCALNPGKCCQRLDGTFANNVCCPANTRCGWTDAGSPGCVVFDFQCKPVGLTNCTN